MFKYTSAVIGCGSIGALKPDHIDYPGSPNILTHANALLMHPDVELTALIDNNKDQLTKAQGKWHAQVAIESYNLFIMGNKVPDILVVAVPTKHHFEVLNAVLSHPDKPKIIIAEKPFCESIDEVIALKETYQVPILIDYIRRFANGYKTIKANIDSGKYGKALNCRIVYTRGLKREGCHAIDLMRHFFGKCNYWEVSCGNPLNDRTENDPTFEVVSEFDGCNSVIFQPCDGRKYGIFEIDICFEETRLRLIDNGLYLEQYRINEENEWGHKSLDYSLTTVLRTETGLTTALYNVVDNAVKFLDGKEELICTVDDALEVQKILSDD